MPSRADFEAMDAADPLARFRDLFALPEGVIYLDGNSLGPLPRATPARVAEVVEQEWGERLIRGWGECGWMAAPLRVGDKIARLIGAEPGTVAVADSTSVNAYKLLSAALGLRPERRMILSERSNFPTDLYMAEGLCAQLGRGHSLRLVDADEIVAAIDGEAAVVLLTHVNYRTGRLADMVAVTRAAHEAGALVLWDLAHSVGAVPVDLVGCDADFAIGCGYKYLNGGPGAPAFLYVARRLQDGLRLPLTGWLGHADPFAFEPGYRPAAGIARTIVGTPGVIGLAALEVGVEIALSAPMTLVREKSLRQTNLFAELVEQSCPGVFGLVSPVDPVQRGSQACLSHPDAAAIMERLIARGVIGDFRPPDILRFGVTPLYTRFVDVWDAVQAVAAFARA